MPELSTNFEFTINGSDTVQVNHPGDSTAEEYISDKVKGDGYYKGGDGSHTYALKVAGFYGTIIIQATLVAEPTADDWFDVDSTEHTATVAGGTVNRDGSYMYNFDGNFVWLRAKITNFTDGTVNYIRVNY
jgi:hypothetical protein